MSTKIQILSNTNYPLSEVLKTELIENNKINIAVAFLKKSGIEQIYKALDFSLTNNNSKMEIIVGLDFKTTDYNALLTLQELKSKYDNFNFYCFGDKKDNYNELVFHPKIYLFKNENQNNVRYTSIIGSSNLTGGGLSSNFEVNTIFRENKPVYFSQLEAIYNEIKFTDSIFIPNKYYLEKYSDIRKTFDKSGEKIQSSINDKIKELKQDEQKLPGTIPSIKQLIIRIIKKHQKSSNDSIPLKIIYEDLEQLVKEEKLVFKMDTFRNSIRGELNKHELHSIHPDCMQLFIRSENKKGFYSLTEKGMQYEGR